MLPNPTCFKTVLMFGLLMATTGTIYSQEPEPGKQIDAVFKYKIEGKEKELKYCLYVPSNYSSEKKLPLMLFLHGAGERGDDLGQVKKWGPPKRVADDKEFPFILISPQCPKSSWWTSRLDGLGRLVDDVAGRLKVDKDRMYCTGLSMGGYGTWALCAKYPKLFAAAAPVCGGGKVDTADALKQIPIWAFHGDADRVVPFAESEKMVNAIKEAGGKNIKLTRYEGVGHNSWSQAYATKELYKWFLSHRRSAQ